MPAQVELIRSVDDDIHNVAAIQPPRRREIDIAVHLRRIKLRAADIIRAVAFINNHSQRTADFLLGHFECYILLNFHKPVETPLFNVFRYRIGKIAGSESALLLTVCECSEPLETLFLNKFDQAVERLSYLCLKTAEAFQIEP